MLGWDSMRASITGLFHFNSFGMPFIGADACGFLGHTDEELCTRFVKILNFINIKILKIIL